MSKKTPAKLTTAPTNERKAKARCGGFSSSRRAEKMRKVTADQPMERRRSSHGAQGGASVQLAKTFQTRLVDAHIDKAIMLKLIIILGLTSLLFGLWIPVVFVLR